MWKTLYEVFLFLCVILSVSTIWYDSPFQTEILYSTWIVFFCDYIVMLYLSEKRWEYIKKHPFDLIALIPLDSIFQGAKLARLYRLWRIKTIAKRFSNPMVGKAMKYTPKHWFLTSFMAVVLSTIPFYFFEPLVNSATDALKWSFGSILFFGNSDVEPETFIGKVLIILLTIIGLVMHALIVKLMLINIDRVKNYRQKKRSKTDAA
ncbi:ion channel [Pseudalkalibacillus caeni]|uniref:Potassium channel domain-containing protein n=1 Tax=Exobacillus caeni TaxID=2574798 RepID=A0A5R9FB44_9BACL|nr:ion channel [Pseudalkalibacillus caeni]TLS36845.1 hypothetical protein FCL54_12880 [Pseudalkalibacillus caeni]